MSIDAKRTGVFSRRVFIIAVFKILAFFIIAGRLFYLQVFSHKKYFDKSVENHTKTFILPANRGIITDVSGKEIAYNAKYWRVIYKDRKKNFEMINKVLDILNVKDKSRDVVLKRFQKNPFEEFVIYEFLSSSQVIDIELQIPHLEGIFVMESMARYYKHSNAYSNIIGYIKTPTVDDLKSGKSQHPDVKIGATGIERTFNNVLTGHHGYQNIETDAFGHKIQDLERVEPINGDPLQLTINSNIQEFMYNLVQDSSIMSSVVINVHNGDIVGLISSPTFNSERLSQKISSDDWLDIANDPNKPMLNRVFQSTYSPGSVFKPLVAITALERGFDPSKKFYCNGSFRIGRRLARCWKPSGHGNMDMHNALKHSCNVYFYNIADYITSTDLRDVAEVLGLNQIYPSLKLTSQAKGLVPDEKWASSIGIGWYKGDLVNTIIGQGSVACTTLQLAVMTGRVAGGRSIIPNILQSQSSDMVSNVNIASKNLATIRNAMFAGVNTQGGTSFSQRITEEGYEFAGKTGTAQVVSKFVGLHEKYKVAAERPHGLFMGFAPFHDPKFAIATIFEKGGYGATNALPFSKKVLHYAQKVYEDKNDDAQVLLQKYLQK